MTTPRLSITQLRLARLASQRLTVACNDDGATPAQVAEDVCGVQAQDLGAALLGMSARRKGLTVDDVEAARVEERSVAVTWLMRGTLHLVPTADLPWMVALFGPYFARKEQRRLRQLELAEPLVETAVGAIAQMLAESGPLTKAEIAEGLATRGVRIDAKGQQPFHLIANAAARGLVCVGPKRGAKLTYASVPAWLGVEAPARIVRHDAIAELARRYVASFGPVAAADFAAWSGLGMPAARTAFASIAAEMHVVDVEGAPLLIAPGSRAETCAPRAPSGEVVRLPAWDEYLLGYADKSFALPPELAEEIRPGGVSVRPSVIEDGLVTGVWRPGAERA